MKNDKSAVSHKIARIIVNGNPSEREHKKLLDKFISKNKGKHYEFVITPGGFLLFWFPEILDNVEIDIDEIGENELKLLQQEAEKKIEGFFDKFKESEFQKLKQIADYITIGIDGWNRKESRNIELIAIYDLKKEIIIRWTGKFYPTERQKRRLIKINNLNSHFIELNKQKVVILGCHDLHVYNPRGQSIAKLEGYKNKIAYKFRSKNKKFKPDVILQHPHTTDTPYSWKSSWNVIEKELPSVKHFASAIKYDNGNEEPRRKLEYVLEKTKKGDVIDFY